MGQPQLQSVLRTLLGSDNVYFQPPSNVQMGFPAIVYKRDDIDTDFADNKPYYQSVRYLVTVIDEDPTGETTFKVASLPLCAFLRNFVVENLNHDVFVLYY